MENKIQKEVLDIYIEDIIPNRFQPRLIFDEKEIRELAESIKNHGFIQPLVLRKIQDKYEIIAGERRYKAANLLGLNKVPAIIMDVDDNESAEVAVVENLQRKDLTALEEAKSYKKLLDKGHLNQEQLAVRMGKKQSTISNKLRLLNLDESIQEALLKNKISERHARSLLGLNNIGEQKKILEEIINNRLTVKQTDEIIKKMVNIKNNDFDDQKEQDVQNQYLINDCNIDKIKESAKDINPLNEKKNIDNLLYEENKNDNQGQDNFEKEKLELNDKKPQNKFFPDYENNIEIDNLFKKEDALQAKEKEKININDLLNIDNENKLFPSEENKTSQESFNDSMTNNDIKDEKFNLSNKELIDDNFTGPAEETQEENNKFFANNEFFASKENITPQASINDPMINNDIKDEEFNLSNKELIEDNFTGPAEETQEDNNKLFTNNEFFPPEENKTSQESFNDSMINNDIKGEEFNLSNKELIDDNLIGPAEETQEDNNKFFANEPIIHKKIDEEGKNNNNEKTNTDNLLEEFRNNQIIPSIDNNVEKKDVDLTKAINQIRNKIKDLQEEGFIVDLEEFDFEKNYQIIIKIKKDN